MALRSPQLSFARRFCLGTLLLCLSGSYGIREDETKCEQAAYALQQCCGTMQGHVFYCNYSSGCSGTTNPDISVATAECLLGKSCADLQSAGDCDTDTWPDQKAPSCQ